MEHFYSRFGQTNSGAAGEKKSNMNAAQCEVEDKEVLKKKGEDGILGGVKMEGMRLRLGRSKKKRVRLGRCR